MANENLKKQMVIKLGTTTNEDAQIISNMVDNAAGGGGGEVVNVYFNHNEPTNTQFTPYKDVNLTQAYANFEEFLTAIAGKDVRVFDTYDGQAADQYAPLKIGFVDHQSIQGVGVVIWDSSIARGWQIVGFPMPE